MVTLPPLKVPGPEAIAYSTLRPNWEEIDTWGKIVLTGIEVK